jgi:hypothetical protein
MKAITVRGIDPYLAEAKTSSKGEREKYQPIYYRNAEEKLGY